MQPSINEQIVLSAIEAADPFSLPNEIAKIIAKSIPLNCAAIYSGNNESLKLVGLFVDYYALKIAVDSRGNIFGSAHDGSAIKAINIPQSLTSLDLKKKEIKIGGFPFFVVSQSFKNNIITIVYNTKRKNSKRAERELKKTFPYLNLTIFPLLKLRERFEDSGSFLNMLISDFLKETATLEGHLKFFLKLAIQFFEAEYGLIRVSAFNKEFQALIGENIEDKSSKREFLLKEDEKILCTLAIASNKSIMETSQTHFFVDISLNYLKEVISNFSSNTFNTKVKINNFYLLSKIYESLIEGKIGNLDRIIDTALFIGKNVNLSISELNLLYYMVALKDIGRIIIRYFSKIQSKSFEEEFNESISEELLDYFFIKCDTEKPLREIVKVANEFVGLTEKSGNNLESEIEKLKIASPLKLILKRWLKELELEKCFKIKQCPEILRNNCPASIGTKNCFEAENTLCYYYKDGNCKNCFVFYLKNKRKEIK